MSPFDNPGAAAALIAAADRFAAQAHAGQVRKGAPPLPYIAHPRAVHAIVAAETNDPTAQAAALLHDVLEDCEGITPEDLSARFGAPVAEIVGWLTDPPGAEALPTSARKQRQADKLAAAPPAAQLVKIADQLDNLRGRQDALHAWSAPSHRAYLAGARRVVDACRPGAPRLASRFDAAAQELERVLGAAAK